MMRVPTPVFFMLAPLGRHCIFFEAPTNVASDS